MVLSLWAKTCDPRAWFSDRAQSKEVCKSQGKKIHPVGCCGVTTTSSYFSPTALLLNLLWGDSAVPKDLLGEDCIDLPRHARSQMESGQHHRHRARRSNPTRPERCWEVYATRTPLAWLPKASEIKRNAITTLKEGEREAGLTQGTNPLWNGLQEALERLAFAVDNPVQKNLEP